MITRTALLAAALAASAVLAIGLVAIGLGPQTTPGGQAAMAGFDTVPAAAPDGGPEAVTQYETVYQVAPMAVSEAEPTPSPIIVTRVVAAAHEGDHHDGDHHHGDGHDSHDGHGDDD